MFEVCTCGECRFFNQKTHLCSQRNEITEDCDCGPLNHHCNAKMTFKEKCLELFYKIKRIFSRHSQREDNFLAIMNEFENDKEIE